MTAARRKARVIAIAMQKGGVGKTTSTINLADALAQQGLRVLVVDVVEQAHSTEGLGVAVGDDDATIYEVLHTDRDERVPLNETIKPTAIDGLHVVPGHMAVKKLEDGGLGPGGHMRLAKALDALTDYDVVLIDTPPALGTMTEAALYAADDVLAVLEAGHDEVKALVTLGNSVLDIQESGFNDELDIRYVLLADFESQTKVAQDVQKSLIRDWGAWNDGGAYLGEIPHTTRVREAKGRQMPVRLHAPTSAATVAYKDAGQRIAERIRS